MDSTQPTLRQYIKEKNDWSEVTFDEVDWTSLGGCLKPLSISKCAKVVKMMHNWQNTGRQKGLFCMGMDTTVEDDEVTVQLEKCPMGCGV